MSGATIEREAARLRAELAERLITEGAVTSSAWRAAFADVPRHVFVPVFYRQSRTEQPAVDLSTPDEWLHGVYADQLLVVSPDVKSSSTVPSLMARMLEALDPADGDRVLEIGTGTGYNAGLLSHRLGDSNVVSIDIAADLVNDAKARLASIGYHPTLVVGDGAGGWPSDAPYDGIIATCAPDSVPETWLDQVRPGGRIVAPIATGVAVIDVAPGRKGEGRFLPGGAFFMSLRPTPGQSDLAVQIADIKSAIASTRATDLDEMVWFDSDFRFVLSAVVPDLRFLTKLDSGIAIFTHPDGSWVRLDDNTVAQGGSRRLWDSVEKAHRQWDELGRPSREKFSLTIDGCTQHVRLDGSDVAWLLPRGR
ncbi:methyltransferase domain-containing protein [Kribbella deserti]|uniref:Protein-L-isoaspartate O-methyltransferase n=1 Tax=Kribbella deserti TaxID=1926257 RepID=A0ABV6QRZ7_9ACTN